MEPTVEPQNPSAPAGQSAPHSLSGRWMVAGIFVFAITATGFLYGYWKLHIGPFVPLQKALAKEFERSRPRVEGGQRKMHKGTPRILRITMKIDFDPDANEGRTNEFAGRVASFARANFDLSTYEILEVHFFWPEPEKKIHEWTAELPTEGIDRPDGVRH